MQTLQYYSNEKNAKLSKGEKHMKQKHYIKLSHPTRGGERRMSNRLIELRPSKPAHHSFVGLSFFFRNGRIVVITAAIICRILRNIFIRFFGWNIIYNLTSNIELIDIRKNIG